MKGDEFFSCLEQVLQENGHNITVGEMLHCIRALAKIEVDLKPNQPGPMGPMGAMGEPGIPGADAWDKYAFDPECEQLIEVSWKGIPFSFPVAKHISSSVPAGELSYGDIAYTKTVFGKEVVERMAAFWYREYEKLKEISLFINEEDSCHLKDIVKYNSYPDPLKVC